MNLPEELIRVSEKSNNSEKKVLLEPLRILDGFIAARDSQEKENLLFVTYNSDMKNTTALLDKVKGNLLKTQLVGL